MRAFGERNAQNSPLQGSAADLIKVAMIRIHAPSGDEGLQSRMLLQVHDELVFEAPPEELERMRRWCRNHMEGVVELEVPLVVDLGVGAELAGREAMKRYRFRFSERPSSSCPTSSRCSTRSKRPVVEPDTPMFDAARQSWQPVARHPEVRAAWAERARYRPPGSPARPARRCPRSGRRPRATRRPAAGRPTRMVSAGAIGCRSRSRCRRSEPKSTRSIAVGLALVVGAAPAGGTGRRAVRRARLVRVAARAVRWSRTP